MFTEPVLDLDTDMLAKLWESENTRKAEGNAALGVDGSDLRSTDLFCKLLEDEGIEIEYKDGRMDQSPPSPRTTRSCGTFCVSTTTSAFVRWRKRALRKNPLCCRPARQRWAGWRQGDLHLFIYFTLELARYDLRGRRMQLAQFQTWFPYPSSGQGAEWILSGAGRCVADRMPRAALFGRRAAGRGNSEIQEQRDLMSISPLISTKNRSTNPSLMIRARRKMEAKRGNGQAGTPDVAVTVPVVSSSRRLRHRASTVLAST